MGCESLSESKESKMASINLIKALTTLRVVATATDDQLIRALCLDVLEETDTEIREKLMQTCYSESIDSVRSELMNQYG